MNLVDSSGWLEYFEDGANADFFAPAIEETQSLLVSPINLYEVFKRITQQRGEGDALQAVAVMMQGKLVEVSPELALDAAKLSVDYRLPMANSLLLATALAQDAVLWTEDEHFEQINGVRYIPKNT